MPTVTAATPKPCRPFGRGVRAVQFSFRHNSVHHSPSGHARAGPQADAASFIPAALRFADGSRASSTAGAPARRNRSHPAFFQGREGRRPFQHPTGDRVGLLVNGLGGTPPIPGCCRSCAPIPYSELSIKSELRVGEHGRLDYQVF
jgi:hypothetical protein